jgi:hypothetical protein
MVNNKIGCSAGKTSLIDPNNFSGTQFDNTSVPLEDLNISVQLSTYKKRTYHYQLVVAITVKVLKLLRLILSRVVLLTNVLTTNIY